MSERFKAAAIQMNTILYDKLENLSKARSLVEQAIEQQAKLIVLPELFNTGYRVEDRDLEMAECIPGTTTSWMEDISKQHKVYLVAAILEKGLTQGTVYDTAILTGPKGLIGTYRKTHLWDMENVRFTKGNEFPVYATPLGNIGMQICYEVGFPEGARILTLKGADILVYPSAFGAARSYAWDLATRARGLENGAYVIASNRSGTEKEETIFGGRTRIVDPTGKVLSEAIADDEVIISEIHLDQIVQQRHAIPYLRDLNKPLYERVFSEAFKST
ncbi:MAG: carbon-nitrogen hydrolase family protein [Paenibacillaceae bacterium]